MSKGITIISDLRSFFSENENNRAWLGHVSVETTNIYAEVNLERAYELEKRLVNAAK